MQWEKSEATTEAKKVIRRLEIDVIAKVGHSQRQRKGTGKAKAEAKTKAVCSGKR